MYNNSVFKSTAVQLTTFNLQNVYITTFAQFRNKAIVLKKQLLEEIFYLMVFLRNDIHFFLTIRRNSYTFSQTLSISLKGFFSLFTTAVQPLWILSPSHTYLPWSSGRSWITSWPMKETSPWARTSSWTSIRSYSGTW